LLLKKFVVKRNWWKDTNKILPKNKKKHITKALATRYTKELCPPIGKKYKIKLVERYEKKLCRAQK
jgi:hypothetical protein